MARDNKKNSDVDFEDELENRADEKTIQRAFVRSLIAIVAIGVVVGAVVLAINFWPKPPKELSNTKVAAPELRKIELDLVPQVTFKNVTTEAGIQFQHENGAQGEKLLPETMGSGVAFFDYDNDNDNDLFVVNSCEWKLEETPEESTLKLFQNDGKGNFKDVSAEVGLNIKMYGMGVAVGDFDNDGWRDLFISAVGPSKLFRNVEGKFTDVTADAGVAGAADQWSTGCGFFDYDRDGKLDLFVCNYVVWSREIDLSLKSTLDGKTRAYAPPRQFTGTFPYLYRNEGNGKFRDVSAEAGIQVRNPNTNVAVAKSLGISFFDANEDGWPDVLVANDTVQNMLFINDKAGKFSELGVGAGIAYGDDGAARGAMGADAAFYRNNDMLAIAIGNFSNEPTSFFVRKPLKANSVEFSDRALANGVGPESRRELKFGIFFFDYDLDGRLDLLSANGHLENEIEKIQKQQKYQQPPHLFWNASPKSRTEFVSVPKEKCGGDMCEVMVGRGSAFGDIDGDGDLDVVLTGCGQPIRLLRNENSLGNNWVRIRLEDPNGQRDALGAKVTLTVGEEKMTRYVTTTRSYLSQSELELTFGLGKGERVDQVEITWPDGSTQTITDTAINKLNVIKKNSESKST